MRRLTFAAAGQDPVAGQALRLDPGTLPVRYVTRLTGTASEPANIVLDRHQAIISQMRRGVPTVVTIPMNAFTGVAARFEAYPDGRVRTTIELVHEDPALTLPLAVSLNPDELAEDWEEWSLALELPLMLPDTTGRLRTVHDGEPQEPLEAPATRRARSILRQRRPRFARRRKTGHMPQLRVVAGREIIARD